MLANGSVIVPDNLYTPDTTATSQTFLAGNGTWKLVDVLNTSASYTVKDLLVTSNLTSTNSTFTTLNVSSDSHLDGTNRLGTTNFTASVDIDNNLTVDRQLQTQSLIVDTTATLNGNATIAGNASIAGNLTVTNTATILGGLNVGDINGSGGVNIAGPLRVGGVSTFSNRVNVLGTATFSNEFNVNGVATFNTATFNKPVTFNDVADFNSTATFEEIDTTQLTVAGVTYPTNYGLYGQVIANFGDGHAEWRNLGDLNFWSLNDDLKTNGFDLLTGSPTVDLALIRGSSINTSSAYINLFTENDGGTLYKSVTVQSDERIHLISSGVDIKIGGKTSVGDSGQIRIGASRTDIDGTVRLSGTLRGGYYTDDRVHVGPNGFEFSDGTRLTTAFPDISGILPIATSSLLGGIKVGSGLNIDPTSGVLSNSYSYTLPFASNSTLGGIRVGAGLAMNPSTGVLSATGGGGSSTGTVSLTSDMYTNGYDIRFNEDYGDTHIRIAQDDLTIGANSSLNVNASYVGIEGGSILDLRLPNVGPDYPRRVKIENSGLEILHDEHIVVNAPEITIGDQIDGFTNIGELRVNKIYNYAGTYAPFFPAGVQYADSTVQITAFHPDGGPLPAV